MDDVEMKVPNGVSAPSGTQQTPSNDHTPTATRRKSVSFPQQPPAPHTAKDSPTTAKILARKPTPFNSDLAETIRESGFGAAVRKDNNNIHQESTDPEDLEDDLELLGGEVCEEEEVDGDEAEIALQIGQGLNRPPPRSPVGKAN